MDFDFKGNNMYKRIIKRILDVFISVLWMPIIGMVFVVVAPIIYFTDKGPVFYAAERLGYKGKAFRMYKFRSMYVNSPDIRNKDGSTYNGEEDPRVTKIGRILRKTSLDELPQFLNVLIGEMSIIGPRPFVTTGYSGYDSLDDRRKKRLEVRPGITGYSQAYFRNSIGQDEKIKNDCFYVDNISFLFDIKIFFHSVFSVLKRKNIYVDQHGKAEGEIEKSVK